MRTTEEPIGDQNDGRIVRLFGATTTQADASPGSEPVQAASAAALKLPDFIRFADIKAAGLITSRATLGRMIKHEGFPRGLLLRPGLRVWPLEEVQAWIVQRREAAAASDPRTRAGNASGASRRARAEVAGGDIA